MRFLHLFLILAIMPFAITAQIDSLLPLSEGWQIIEKPIAYDTLVKQTWPCCINPHGPVGHGPYSSDFYSPLHSESDTTKSEMWSFRPPMPYLLHPSSLEEIVALVQRGAAAKQHFLVVRDDRKVLSEQKTNEAQVADLQPSLYDIYHGRMEWPHGDSIILTRELTIDRLLGSKKGIKQAETVVSKIVKNPARNAHVYKKEGAPPTCYRFFLGEKEFYLIPF